MSTFLGLMFDLLVAATTSPLLENISHELSIISEFQGTKYRYCKYRYRWYRQLWYRIAPLYPLPSPSDLLVLVAWETL